MTYASYHRKINQKCSDMRLFVEKKSTEVQPINAAKIIGAFRAETPTNRSGKREGRTENRTRIVGFKVQSDNRLHHTTRSLVKILDFK